MPRIVKRILTVLSGLLIALQAAGAMAGVVAPDVQDAVRTLAPDAEVPVIIRLSETVDLKSFTDKDKAVRSSKIIKALIDRKDRTQKDLLKFLKNNKVKDPLSLWIINGIAARVPVSLVDELANLPSVERVTLDAVVTLPPEPVVAGLGGTGATNPGDNIIDVGVPELWTLGYQGTGSVVGVMDTGVDASHPDIEPRYRDGPNSWKDLVNGDNTGPYDDHGHGTQVTGIIVGGEASPSGTAIGVAPGAQWIAVKVFDASAKSTLSRLHQGFEWLFDPDSDPNTPDYPDIINNSWYIEGTEGSYNSEFRDNIQVLNDAGIAVVFAAGNSGTAGDVSPANDPGSFAVGAVDWNLNIASFSSRGPSSYDGSFYPHVSAPGVAVLTAHPGAGYTFETGTSFAAPHVVGALALLGATMTGASVSQLLQALKESAVDLGTPGPDNSYGYGLLNAMSAYDWLLTHVGSPFDSDGDGDVDGNDLAVYSAAATSENLAAFAYGFGRNASQ